PQRSLVRVVLLFAFDLFHREGARHFRARRADDRPENRLGAGVDQVFGEQFTVDLDGHAAIVLFDGEFGRRGWAGGKRDGDGEARQRQEQANRAKHGGGPPATEGAIVAGGVRNSKAHIVIAPEAACHYLRAPLFGGLLALGFGRLVIRLERD